MNSTNQFITSAMIINYEDIHLNYYLDNSHIDAMTFAGRRILKDTSFKNFFPKHSLILPSGIHTVFVGSKTSLRNKISDLSIEFVNEIIRMFVNKRYNEKQHSFDPPLFFTCHSKIIPRHRSFDTEFLTQTNIWKECFLKKLAESKSVRKEITDGFVLNFS